MTESDRTAPSPVGPAPPRGPAEPSFKDRRAGMIVFGVLLLLFALMSLIGAGLQLLMLVGFQEMTEGVETEMGSAVFGYAAGFYLLAALCSAWLGIGSILCRRWARALLMVLSAMALVVGVITSVYMVSIIGPMTDQITASVSEEEAAAMVPIFMGCMLAVVVIFYFVLPGAFFLFFRSAHVKATCEHHDPTPRWTDRYPAPMLAGGLLLYFYSLIFFAPIMGTPMPLFGTLLTGVQGWLYAMAVGLLAAFIAMAFMRFERWAWLASVVFVGVFGLSAYLTFRRGGLGEMYEAMGYPSDQVAMMESMGVLRGFPMLILVSAVAMTVFFLWLGRYFIGNQRSRAIG